VHSEYALLANVIVAGRVRLPRCPALRGGIVPGDGIFTAWSYRAGAGRARRSCSTHKPLKAQTAPRMGVIAEVVPNGKALIEHGNGQTVLEAPEVTRRNTRVHFIQPLKSALSEKSAMDCRSRSVSG